MKQTKKRRKTVKRYKLNTKDYKEILERYKKPVQRRKIEKTAKNTLRVKLCGCIKKLERMYQSKSLGICSRTIFNRHRLFRGDFECKQDGKMEVTRKRKRQQKEMKRNRTIRMKGGYSVRIKSLDVLREKIRKYPTKIREYLERLFKEENDKLSFYYTEGNTRYGEDIFISKSKTENMTDRHIHIFLTDSVSKIKYKIKYHKLLGEDENSHQIKKLKLTTYENFKDEIKEDLSKKNKNSYNSSSSTMYNYRTPIRKTTSLSLLLS